MLFANAVFNVFTGVFDCTNCVFHVLDYVRQNIAVFFFFFFFLYYYSTTLAHYITIQLLTLDKLSYKDDFSLHYIHYITKIILLLLT